ncbi:MULTISPECIES: hypothetical protein [Neobacillus]|uniref:Lipoprotein n=1 Tax=Neobacillus citreus TaxID=2833578 RepID=A0A942YD06_9BACI|nr:hypothetical protein [Neobacillus citreus]MCH6267646.1 hypothetical protein [Neobacillus citreus]
MMKKFLFLLLTVMIASSLTGCGEQANEDLKAKIQSSPNENYKGNPHPVVKEEMKLTEEEKAEFNKLKQEIMSTKEGESDE